MEKQNLLRIRLSAKTSAKCTRSADQGCAGVELDSIAKLGIFPFVTTLKAHDSDPRLQFHFPRELADFPLSKGDLGPNCQ
jgi:hypothetical protein